MENIVAWHLCIQLATPALNLIFAFSVPIAPRAYLTSRLRDVLTPTKRPPTIARQLFAFGFPSQRHRQDVFSGVCYRLSEAGDPQLSMYCDISLTPGSSSVRLRFIINLLVND